MSTTILQHVFGDNFQMIYPYFLHLHQATGPQDFENPGHVPHNPRHAEIRDRTKTQYNDANSFQAQGGEHRHIEHPLDLKFRIFVYPCDIGKPHATLSRLVEEVRVGYRAILQLEGD